MRLSWSLTLFLFILGNLNCFAKAELGAKVIYGSDDRSEWYSLQEPTLISASDSSVALVPFEKISPIDNSSVKLSGAVYGVENQLCPEERFFEQESPAFCSGVLIAEDIVLTAGHCIDSLSQCRGVAFVFGFKKNSQSDEAKYFEKSEIFSCREILVKDPFKIADFALVRLDRRVQNHRPARISQSVVGQYPPVLATIGYPSGLPMKISKNGAIRNHSKYLMEASLDVSAGSSGSPVFNSENESLLGILIGGENDFVKLKTRGCKISKQCKNAGCVGEDILKLDVVLPYLENFK